VTHMPGENPAPLTPGQETQPPAQPDGSAPPPEPQTPEDVEAIWRNRFSQRDRAHNAEVESLRQQLDEARRSADAKPTDGQAQPDSYKARFEQSQQELERERQARQVTERRLRFPALSQEVPADDPMWVSGRDETLARLNATFTAPAPPPPTGHVDANNPSRSNLAPKPVAEMSKDELLAELKRLAPNVDAPRQG
jgi:hypothetical protein